ncbi:glycosyltransferase [Sulfurimonas sp.]|uniref:glycosyltransferase family 4 protein n=1 Tax=Sulfurimonas sp. TaxID=2022749 RepID=UPI0025EE77DE|nr:glycosyltransferase [Sulfurimonas sp.]MCK9453832.1 glycosyltransferase [Sulfurimonas sp.]
MPTNNNLILTIENSLEDFQKKGNLDLSLEYYNPNNYFDEVYFISYNPNDLKIKHNKDWLVVISPKYFNFLHKFKRKKIFFLFFSGFVYIYHIFNLIKIIKKNNIKIARTGHPYLMSFSLLLASKFSKIPFVSTIGGDNRLAQSKIGRYHIFNNKFISFFVEEFVLNRSDNVIVPNKYTANYVRSISSQKNITVLPLPLRNELFYRLNDDVCMIEPEYFLFIGRLVGDKHPDFILELYIKFVENNPKTTKKLVIVGNGEMMDELKKRVIDSSLEDKVIFTGFLNTSEIIKYLEKNPICLIPISGFVIYEAAIFGNMIITSDIEWHSEFIEDGINGWVAKYLDINSWLEKLNYIECNLEDSKNKALKLKDKMKELKPENIYAQQIELYKKAVK